MKKIFEKIVEGILACSGFVTSLTIVLIVVFLFSEALGLFSSKVIEEGYVLALNKENRVGELTPAQIKNVFDEELTNWNEVGGEDLPIRLFRLEDITLYYTEEQLGASYENAGACITELVERTPGIIAFVPQQFIVRPDSVHLLERQHHFGEGRLCRCRMVSHGNTCCAVRLFAAHYGDAVGQSVCHPLCIAVWSVGGNLYVGGSQFPGKESAEAHH